MTRGLLLLSLALQRCVLLVRKSRGCLKAEEIKEEGNGDCFQQSQGLAVGSSKDWLLSPVAEELKKSDVQIRIQKVEILSIVSDQIPGNMHALFHLMLTFGSETDFRNPSQGVCLCPNSLFLLVHFSVQIWTVWAILPVSHRLCHYDTVDVWTDMGAIGFFSLGYILAWMIVSGMCSCTNSGAASVALAHGWVWAAEDEAKMKGRSFVAGLLSMEVLYKALCEKKKIIWSQLLEVKEEMKSEGNVRKG